MTDLGKFGVRLASNEIALTAAVTAQHRSLLATYRMNAHRGENAACERILGDIRNFIDLGALDRATDLLIVLALHLRATGRRERRLRMATGRRRDAICLNRWRGVGRPAGGRTPKQIDAPFADSPGSPEGDDGDRPNCE